MLCLGFYWHDLRPLLTRPEVHSMIGVAKTKPALQPWTLTLRTPLRTRHLSPRLAHSSMGKVWTRDGQQQQAQQPHQRVFPGRGHPPVKRTHVWKRESATSQNGADFGSRIDRPSALATQHCVDGEAELVEEPSAKRRRLAAKGRVLPERWAEQVAPNGAQNAPPNLVNGSKSEQDRNKAERAAKEASKQESLRREAAALRKQIAEEEAKVAAAKAAAQRREAQQAAVKRAKKEELELRKNRLDAGFAEAFRITRELAASQKVPVSAAEEAEVKRVLAAKSDHEVLQLKPGADRAAVRKKYRAMTLALHPDKCNAESATDAFQRLVLAYQGVLKYAR